MTHRGDRMDTRTDQYTEYRGNAPGLMIQLEYPTGWRLQEEQGQLDAYRQVRFLGPRNPDDTYTCYVSVRGSPVKSHGGKYESVAELMASYRQYSFRDAKIELERPRTVADQKSQGMTATFTIPPLHKPGLKAIPIPVKTRILFLERASYLYELIYSVDLREYDRHAEPFERLVRTFRFR